MSDEGFDQLGGSLLGRKIRWKSVVFGDPCEGVIHDASAWARVRSDRRANSYSHSALPPCGLLHGPGRLSREAGPHGRRTKEALSLKLKMRSAQRGYGTEPGLQATQSPSDWERLPTWTTEAQQGYARRTRDFASPSRNGRLEPLLRRQASPGLPWKHMLPGDASSGYRQPCVRHPDPPSTGLCRGLRPGAETPAGRASLERAVPPAPSGRKAAAGCGGDDPAPFRHAFRPRLDRMSA